MRTTRKTQRNHPQSGTGKIQDIYKSSEQLINEPMKMRQRVAKVEVADTERKQMEQRIEHLNLVLRTIRNVNQLIAKEKNRDRLLKDICGNLVESRGYYNAWVAILDKSEGLVTTAEAGLGREFSLMVKRLKRGEFTDCVRRTLRQSDIMLIENPLSTCGDCPLVENYQGRGEMAVRLEHSGKVYGILSVSIPVELIADKEEQALFKEVGSDISFALYNIDLGEKYKQAEEALKESERKYRTLVENVPQKIFYKDRNSVYISCNSSYALDLKIKPEEITGRTDYEFYPKELAEKYRADDRRIIESEEAESIEERYIQDGQARIVQTFKTPIKDDEGNVVSVLGIFHDITERKRTEHKLTERMKELQCLYGISKFAEIPDITLGELYQEVVNLLPSGCRYPEIIGARITINDMKFETKNYTDTEWKQSSDVKVYGEKAGKVEVSYLEERLEIDEEPFLKEEGQVLDAVAKQLARITERKQAEDAIKQAAKEWRVTFDSIADPVSIHDKDFRLVRVNKAFADIFNVKPEELVGKTCYQVVHGTNECVPNCSHMKTLKTGEPAMEDFFEPHLGIHLEVATSPIFNEKGEVVASVHVARDITERKQMEKALEKLNQHLWAKVSELETFSYAVAHDLKSPLVSIQGFVGMLQDDIQNQDAERTSEDIRLIGSGVRRMGQLLEETLEYSHSGRLAKPAEDIPFGEIVEEALEQFAQRVRSIGATISLAETFPSVCVDRMMIKRVLTNLIQNSIAYGDKTRLLTIEISYRLSEGETVFFVRDNGIGIDASEMEKVFDLFYRGTAESEGSGAGLAIVKKIIEAHGGRIWIESQPGEGTTMCFTLPRQSSMNNGG